MNAPLVTHDPAFQPLDSLNRPTQGIVFGVVAPKHLKTCFNGTIRLRLRNESFGHAFVRDGDLFRHFHLVDCGDHWELGFECGANCRFSLC